MSHSALSRTTTGAPLAVALLGLQSVELMERASAYEASCAHEAGAPTALVRTVMLCGLVAVSSYSRMRGRIADELGSVMSGAGWEVDVAVRLTTDGGVAGAFRLPVAEDFAATAEFRLGQFETGETQLEVFTGVSYNPSYRLQAALGQPIHCDLVTVVQGSKGRLGGWSAQPIAVGDLSEVLEVVQRCVSPVLKRAPANARAHADVDRLLQAVRRRGGLAETWAVPLILAGSGRIDEARRALAGYLRSTSLSLYGEFARNLAVWMDSGSDLPDWPTGPTPEQSTQKVTLPPWKLAAAVPAVAKLLTLIKESVEQKDRSTPSWLRPPGQARYPVGPLAAHVPVEVLPGMPAILERVVVALSRTRKDGTPASQRDDPPVWGAAWLSWDPELEDAPPSVLVNIGEFTVGRLGPESAAPFGRALESSSRLDLLPYTGYILGRQANPSGYRLLLHSTWRPEPGSGGHALPW